MAADDLTPRVPESAPIVSPAEKRMAELLVQMERTASEIRTSLEEAKTVATRAYAHAPRIEDAPTSSSPVVSLPPAEAMSLRAIEHTVTTRQTTKREDRLSKLALAVLIFGAAVFNWLASQGHH